MEENAGLQADAPFYLLRSKATCRNCGAETIVIGEVRRRWLVAGARGAIPTPAPPWKCRAVQRALHD